jgi:hypothetical protein
LRQANLPSLIALPQKGITPHRQTHLDRTPHRQSRLDSQADCDLGDFRKVCPHTGQSSQLFIDANGGGAQFLTKLAGVVVLAHAQELITNLR